MYLLFIMFQKFFQSFHPKVYLKIKIISAQASVESFSIKSRYKINIVILLNIRLILSHPTSDCDIPGVTMTDHTTHLPTSAYWGD